MYNQLTTIPQILNQTVKKDSIEWQIPDRVSAAFMFIEKMGYSFIAKVKVEKKHWWNRSWETFITHAPVQSDALKKGLEFLEGHGYAIDPGTARLDRMIDDPDHF